MPKKIIIAVMISAAALAGLFVLLRPEPETSDKPANSRQNTSSQQETNQPKPQTFAFTLQNGAAVQTPETFEVTQGEKVAIRVKSDSQQEIHLHGYDMTAQAAPGSPAKLEFTADTAGQFKLNLHGQDSGGHSHGGGLGTLLVRPE